MSYNPQNPNGQATSANSEPVVIASDQSAVPISAASLPLPTGAATAANQSTANTSLASIDGKITAVNTGAVVVSSSALPTGAATSTKQSDGSQKTQLVDGSGNVIGATSNALDVNIKSNAGTDTVTGNIASGVADSGNPVKVGAKYNSTKPTFADGQRGDLQIGTRGSLGVQLMNVDGTTGATVGGPTDGAGASNGIFANSQALVFNGTTWDRNRSATSVAGTTGTGVPAAGVLGFDGTNYQRLKTDTSGQLIISASTVGTSDGTTTGSVVAGDAGQNAQVTAGARKEVSFTTTTVQAVATTDVSNYRWVSVHITSQGTSSTVTFQGSNDNSNWVSVGLIQSATTSGAGTTFTTSSGLIYQGPVGYRYFRLNITGISAGTTAGVVEFFASPAGAISVGANVGGGAADGAALSGNPVRIGGSDGTNIRTLKTDASGNIQTGGDVASAAADSGNPVKVGAKYNATKPTFTDGQRGDLQIGTKGALNVQLVDPDGTNQTNVSAPSDGLSSVNSLRTFALGGVYNGTTWDRMRSGGVTGMLGVGGDTAAAAADAGNPVKVGAKYNATKPTYTDGQRGDLQIGTRGSLIVQIAQSDGTGAASTASINSDAVSAGQSGLLAAAAGLVYNGTTWDRARSGGVTGMVGVSGDTASGSSDAGNPVKTGGLAKTALPTAVSDGQRVGTMMDKFGRQVTLVGTIRDLTGTQTTTISASTAETTIVTAGASGVFNDLVMLIISNTSASTNTRIDFRDATGGSVLFSLQSVGGAAPVGFSLPIPIPQTTAANNWTAQCATSTTDVRIYAVYAKNK